MDDRPTTTMTSHDIARALADFARGDTFSEHLSADVVLEFPYGPSLGLPSLVVGLTDVRERLGAAQASGLRLHSPTVLTMSDGRFVTEYTGVCRGATGVHLEVPLIAVIETHGPAITRIREYWDTRALAGLADA